MLKEYFCRTYYGKEQRLQRALNFLYHDLKHGEIMMLLRKKEITVNGTRPQLDTLIKEGDILKIYNPPSALNLNIIYEDKNIIVLYKPKGIISDGKYSFEGLVKYKFSKDYRLLHRLDTNTEGLLIFAKNDEVYDNLLKATKKCQIKKYYLAKVNGIIKKDNFVLENYLVKDKRQGFVRLYKDKKPNSIYVRSECKVKSYGDDWTEVEVMIKEGKTHQIRAQLKEYGHFVLGDNKYGVGEINRKNNHKKQQLTAFKIIFDLDKTNCLSYLNNEIIVL